MLSDNKLVEIFGTIKVAERNRKGSLNGFIVIDQVDNEPVDNQKYILSQDNLENSTISKDLIGRKVRFQKRQNKNAANFVYLIDNASVLQPLKQTELSLEKNDIPAMVGNSIASLLTEACQSCDSYQFEKLTFSIIKLLGIHCAFAFYGHKQGGMADGYFRLENLAVLYDCTLRPEFKDGKLEKDQQIRNYIMQMMHNEVCVSPKERIYEHFLNNKKEVWLITRGSSKMLLKVNEVVVKEVSIFDLIALVSKRVKLTSYRADELLENLRLIEEKAQ